MTDKPTICLNMIVKNEAHIIVETLNSVLPLIDTWAIVDTGSTDGTQDIIREFFAEHGIDGKLEERPWVNFGHNRTEALQLAAGLADYTWVIDADDLVVGDLDLSNLDGDSYQLRYGTEFTYWRTQIFRSSLPWSYEGVLHEFPFCNAVQVTSERLNGDYHILRRALGDRSKNPDKFIDDVRVLAEDLKRNPDNPRTMFYLAQSHKDAGNLSEALIMYERRINAGGWREEVFFSLLQRARCMAALGRSFYDVQSAYLECYNAYPKRAEPLHELARTCRLTNRFALGYMYGSWGAEIPYPENDVLFISADVYKWKIKDEASICAYYVGEYAKSLDMCFELLDSGSVPEDNVDRIMQNKKFASDALSDHVLGSVVSVTDDLVKSEVVEFKARFGNKWMWKVWIDDSTITRKGVCKSEEAVRQMVEVESYNALEKYLLMQE
jgi:glycosyltransferase involved in cell wall biosynthesis